MAPLGRTVPRSASVRMELPVTQLWGPAPVPLASLETPVCRVSQEGAPPRVPPGFDPGECEGLPVLQLGSAHTWGSSCQCRGPDPEGLHLYLPISSVVCPLSWHGPGYQRPCKYEHQCPCNSQTGNCNLTRAPTLNSIVSQGAGEGLPVPSRPSASPWCLTVKPSLQPSEVTVRTGSLSLLTG